jgi:hypothetical protein
MGIAAPALAQDKAAVDHGIKVYAAQQCSVCALLMGYLCRPYTANMGWVRILYRW